MTREKTHPPVAMESRGKRAKKSVLHIFMRSKKRGSTGSGFVVQSDDTGSIILTVAHVLKSIKKNPQSKIYVREMMLTGGVRQFPATIIHIDYNADVAILRAKALKRAVPLRFSPDLEIDQSAMAIGYSNPNNLLNKPPLIKIPVVSPGRLLSGKVKVSKEPGIPLEMIRVNCVAMPGMSGGPVLNLTGVMGMIKSGKPGITNAVSNDTIGAVMKDYLGYEPDSDHALEGLISDVAATASS